MARGDATCALCGKPLRLRSGQEEYWAEIEYDFSLAVGPDCFKKIQAAGKAGLPRPGTDDRLYPEGTHGEYGEDGGVTETVTEAEETARRGSDRDDNDATDQIPTIAEMRRDGAVTRRKIEQDDEAAFYGHMEQAKRLCIARNAPPDGWGMRGEDYELFSAELGYKGKRGQQLPRLYQPYGEKVMAWVTTEREQALARGEMYEYPTWQSALREMVLLWDGHRKPNSKTAAETARPDDARVAEIIAETTAKITVQEQHIKSLTADKGELSDRLAETESRLVQAEARIVQLEMELAKRPPPESGDTPEAPQGAAPVIAQFLPEGQLRDKGILRKPPRKAHR